MDNRNAEFVGSIPANYHRFLGPVFFHEFADDLAARVAVRAGARVLEVACGTGIVTERLARRLAGIAALIATDLNEAMITHAQQRGEYGGHVTWQTADGTKLPFEDEMFDAVVCQFGLMFFPDKTGGLREAFRVLRRGGRFYFNVWDALERNPIGHIAHRTLTGFFPDNPPQFWTVPFGLSDPAPIRGWLTDAGFVDITVETLDKTGTSPSAAEAASGLVEGNPSYVDIMNRRPDALPDIKAAMTKNVAAELGDPVSTPLRAHVFTARKR